MSASDTGVRVRAPAKLILSGEHAVVYGHPAIAMAVNRYTESHVRFSSPFHFSFHLLGLDFRQQVTVEALKRLKRQLDKDYHAFHLGQLSIREVLKHPFELTLYTAMSVLERIKHAMPMGLDIVTDSTIPMGCGMGSSAASVVSLIFALSRLLDLSLSLDDYLRLGIQSENLQHGYSSGLDLQIIYQGGCLHYQHGQFSARPLPTFPFYLIHTGTPDSPTGESVLHAKPFFQDPALGEAFETLTHAWDQTLPHATLTDVQNLIRDNHQLLIHIGVVPQRVQTCIQTLEKAGMAAKICGAGSVRGDAAGVVLVATDEPLEHLQQLVTPFGYDVLSVTGEPYGVQLIQ